MFYNIYCPKIALRICIAAIFFVSLRAKYTIMDRIQDVHALEERIYELVDGYLQEVDCYATAPVLAVEWLER